MSGDGSRTKLEWVLRGGDDEGWREVARALDVHPLVARLLCQRGLADLDRAHAFLNPSLKQMHDPFLMKDMDRAVRSVLVALDRGERIVIHGDYDVDGISSVSVLYGFLRDLGANVGYYVPTRDSDGYGVNAATVRRLADDGCDLLITTDCGVSNVAEIALAKKLGLRVVVVDHHSVPAELPPADAILNPLQSDCDYPFEGLAACGVAFNFAVALRRELRSRGVFKHVPEPDLREQLDLVALGTVADVMPLTDVNRIFVRYGLEVLSMRKRAGISALIDRLQRVEASVSAQTISYGLAPRLNAAGRVDDASICVELLTTRDYGRAIELAGELEQLNTRRQSIERDILEAALPQARQQVDAGHRILVVGDEGWSRGVLGIVASRLMEAFGRPAIVVGMEDGEASGSARSVAGISILEALERSSVHLNTFGGHVSAAGLSLDADRLDTFREAIGHAAEAMLADQPPPRPRLVLDGTVDLKALDRRFTADLRRLAPFGEANAEPVFLAKRAEASGVRVVGKNHLRARFQDATGALDGIGFKMSTLAPLLDEPVAVAFTPRYSVFRGRGQLEMLLKDIRCADDGAPDRIADPPGNDDA